MTRNLNITVNRLSLAKNRETGKNIGSDHLPIFIRIGNFMNSEIIGKPTNSDYGVIFQNLGESFPRHPAQLYESFCYLLIFLLLWFVYWKTDKKQKIGFLFGLFLVLLWTVRFFVEFLKEPQVEERAIWLINTGQWLSIPFIIAGLYFMLRPSKRVAA
jgi:prolipoprotein diacylglyceryltransferase